MRGLGTAPKTADTDEAGVWLSVGDLMSRSEEHTSELQSQR